MSPELTAEEIELLTKGGETFLHSHPRHIMDADDVYNMQAARLIKAVDANYSVLSNDELILVDTSDGNITITLPHSKFKKEYQVIKTSNANTLTVVPTAPDTILGVATGVAVVAGYTSLNFKMDSIRSNWVLV